MKVEIEGDTIVSEVEIAASPEAVFQALVDPAQLAAWWGADQMYRTSDWKMDVRAGGSWSCVAQNAKGTMTVGGKIVEFDRPRVLAYTWNPSWDKIPETTIRYSLEPVPSGTRLRLVHSGFAGQAESQKGHTQGWGMVLGWLKTYLDAAKR